MLNTRNEIKTKTAQDSSKLLIGCGDCQSIGGSEKPELKRRYIYVSVRLAVRFSSTYIRQKGEGLGGVCCKII